MVFVDQTRFEPVQLEEQLADESGGLERVSGGFAAKECGGDGTEPLEGELVEGVVRQMVTGLGAMPKGNERLGHV